MFPSVFHLDFIGFYITLKADRDLTWLTLHHKNVLLQLATSNKKIIHLMLDLTHTLIN